MKYRLKDFVKRAKRYVARVLKECLRPRGKFDRFKASVRSSTWKKHDEILSWAQSRVEMAAIDDIQQIEDPLVARGLELRREVAARFQGKHRELAQKLRVLIHVPDFKDSPGGFSLFSNLISALNFVGIPSRSLQWCDTTEDVLNTFMPTCLMTSDHDSYLSRIDWNAVQAWRKKHTLLLGLTASLQREGNTPLNDRLVSAKEHGVAFYFCFKASEYVNSRSEYQPFTQEGFPLVSIEFGANPVHYHPVVREVKDLDYIFLASSNPEKQNRYLQFLSPIVKKYEGFIDGPGWSRISHYASASTHKYLYSRACVGLNLHIEDSILFPSELNERTYILAACGIPQLVDNAMLLPNRFSSDSVFVVDSPKKYFDTFISIFENPVEAARRSANALEEVYKRHTVYHRADKMVTELVSRFQNELAGD
jgi:hypothetical protein